MSTVPQLKRHALGLPAGSVRATHLLIVVGLVCASLLLPTQRFSAVSPYLIYLLMLMLGHYFAHRGNPGDDDRHPLYLPKGVIRFLVIVALIGTIGWRSYENPHELHEQFKATADGMKDEPILPLLVLGGFFFGVLVRSAMGRNNSSDAYQDLEAWVSLISTLGLFVAGIIHLVVNPTMSEPLKLPHWEGFLAAIVAFYFGSRS